MAFVFYDTETSGTNTAFDQILQFAAVRTDDQLHELEPFEVRSRLLPDIAPSPRALLVNRASVYQLADQNIPSHYEMARRIHKKLLSWSPAVFVGFNSIGFDEHLLRQAFYKTLHPVYLTNTNGNSRCDVMRLIQAASIFAPDAIVIPVGEKNQKTYKLDQVAPANGFSHEDAHDALADVRATVHLCRLLRDRSPQLWSSTIQLCRKPAVIDFIATHPIFCLTDFYWGRCYSWIVAMIGNNRDNTNEIYVYNLAVDPQSLVGLSELGLPFRLGQRPKPLRRVRANAIPILSRVEHAPEFAEGLAVGFDELHRRAAVLQANAGLRARLISAFEANREVREPSPHIEQQIYDSFFTESDERLMETFHTVAWEERLPIVDQFEDERLREFGYRLVHCERPDLLDDAARRRHDDRIARHLLGLDNAVGWLTLREAIQQANDILVDTDLRHIREHRDYLQRKLAEAMRLTL